jgi:hypothetical protein
MKKYDWNTEDIEQVLKWLLNPDTRSKSKNKVYFTRYMYDTTCLNLKWEMCIVNFCCTICNQWKNMTHTFWKADLYNNYHLSWKYTLRISYPSKNWFGPCNRFQPVPNIRVTDIGKSGKSDTLCVLWIRYKMTR